ncbi:MAG TPA: serine hydrolase domain-containing protein, partial [Pirellulaceae bacterium]|nr:serine hydrolase domain-containing protein [Pirellulaceae bacterium]
MATVNQATDVTRCTRESQQAASMMLGARLLLGTVLLLGAALSFAASQAAVGGEFALTDGKPAEVGMRDETLRAAVATMSSAVERGEIRGAVVLVARRGRIVLHEAVGWADFGAKRPMQRDTVFHVASNTKPVLAAATLQLVEQGKLDLDVDVGNYLPAFEKEAYRGVTLRRLLSHTSGLRIGPIFIEPLSAKSAELPGGPTLQSEVARFAALAPEVKPGTSYSYNNPGFNIVGAVIEKVTGQPIDVVLERQIYKPLEMTSTGHVDRSGLVERRAVIETRKGDAWTKTYKPGDPPKYPFVRSSGGMLTTASDYAKFLQLFLNEGRHLGHELLKPRSVAAATTALTRSIYTDEQLKKQTSFYGLGWAVGVDGTFSHG